MQFEKSENKKQSLIKSVIEESKKIRVERGEDFYSDKKNIEQNNQELIPKKPAPKSVHLYNIDEKIETFLNAESEKTETKWGLRKNAGMGSLIQKFIGNFIELKAREEKQLKHIKKIIDDFRSNLGSCQSGFSLVEIMIGAAMLGGIGLGVATMTKNMTKGNLKAQTDSESLLAFNEMVGILSDPTNCLATFMGKSAASDTINQLSYKGSAKFVTNTAFGNNNLKILSYSIGGYNPTLKESTLTINFEKKQMLGGGSIPKNLKLFTEVDGAGKISGCRALATYSQDLWKLSTETPGGIFYAGNIGVGITAPTAMLDVAGGIKIGAVGSDSSTTCTGAGTTRYNATSDKMEYCNKLGKWVAFGGSAVVTTGGAITTSGAYTIHTFTSSGMFIAGRNMTVDYLVVGGGGAGSSGGGGGGGVRIGTGLSISAQSYNVVVGAGGIDAGYGQPAGAASGSSTFSSITASGGGGALSRDFYVLGTGGSGGGHAVTAYAFEFGPGAAGNAGGYSPIEGYAGGGSYNDGGSGAGAGGGGGGGAGGPGGDGTKTTSGGNGAGGAGGIGISSDISGTLTYYGGGGGGNSATTLGTVGGSGGLGGGGRGADAGVHNNTGGAPNTGGGGGGWYVGTSSILSPGGSGIVIIRYLTSGP